MYRPDQEGTQRKTSSNPRRVGNSPSPPISTPPSLPPQQHLSGVTLPVAEFLANNDFCLLNGHKDDSKRTSGAFGNWNKDLPNLLGGPSIRGHTCNISIASVQGHRLSSIPHSCRLSVRNSVVVGEDVRDRKQRHESSLNGSGAWGPSSDSLFQSSQARGSPERHYGAPNSKTSDKRSERGISPSSTQSGRPLVSSASSMASSKWLSSMSSAGTSTSAFTRYSNNSTRLVLTAATSMSSQSWCTQGVSGSYPHADACKCSALARMSITLLRTPPYCWVNYLSNIWSNHKGTHSTRRI
ncbi:hypothetical protein BD310DRAFT_910778 [Dichomitus squalens]|uniref:Uncharacterized protein n=1 Tax=Dichomitus squalens TaxID=114155 RepID=A0A4Q9P9Y6_9APHY|nr:hypothetical protein BD310DRAFT_910778 [Dichomitus squalens]